MVMKLRPNLNNVLEANLYIFPIVFVVHRQILLDRKNFAASYLKVKIRQWIN